MDRFDKIQDLVEKIDNLKKEHLADLSSDQDLSIGIMNLISIEEHLFFSGAKTGKTKFYDIIESVRDIRKEMLKKIVGDNYEGEVWCISKHLLSSSMRFMEVGVKQQSMGRKEEAYKLFEYAYNLYCLFWSFNMHIDDNIVDNSNSKQKIQDQKEHTFNQEDPSINSSKVEVNGNIENIDNPVTINKNAEGGIFSKMRDIVKKALNCCRE